MQLSSFASVHGLLALVAAFALLAACDNLYGDPSSNAFVVNDSLNAVVVQFESGSDVLATVQVAPQTRGRALSVGASASLPAPQIIVMTPDCRPIAESSVSLDYVLITVQTDGQVTFVELTEQSLPDWMRVAYPSQVPEYRSTSLCN